MNNKSLNNLLKYVQYFALYYILNLRINKHFYICINMILMIELDNNLLFAYSQPVLYFIQT